MALLLASVVISTACSRPTSVGGDAFIVTEGAGNYKLGLVQVSAISEDRVLDFMDSKNSEMLTAKKKLQELNAKCSFLASKRIPESKRGMYLYEGLGDVVRELDSKYAECTTLFGNESGRMRDELFQQLPSPTALATTDSDGKFQLTLNEPGRFVLAASAQRKTGDRTERYHWLVRMHANGDNVKVMLSNNNLLGDPLVEPLISIK